MFGDSAADIMAIEADREEHDGGIDAWDLHGGSVEDFDTPPPRARRAPVHARPETVFPWSVRAIPAEPTRAANARRRLAARIAEHRAQDARAHQAAAA